MHRNSENKKLSWWIFDDLSPKTTLFILIWPFLARLLVAIWTKTRMRRLNSEKMDVIVKS